MKSIGNRLVADFGGTHARIAFSKSGHISSLRKFKYSKYDNIISIFSNYLNNKIKIDSIRICGAGPLEKDSIKVTNSELKISIKEINDYFKIKDVMLLNDAEASAHALPFLDKDKCIQLNSNTSNEDNYSLISVGTGLGVSSIKRQNNISTVISSEGGYCHLPYPKKNTLAFEVISFINDIYPRISCERIISGPGLTLLHSTLIKIKENRKEISSPENIVANALQDKQSLSFTACKLLLDFLGSYAASVSLIYGSRGGTFLGGGLLQRIIPLIKESNLVDNFFIKGRMEKYIGSIPFLIIDDDLLAIKGCAVAL